MQVARIGERYRLIERLGAGGVGVVYRAEDTVSGDRVALKVLPRTGGAANLRSEFLALSRLRHDNIVEVFDYGLTEAGDDFFTMELVTGPSLVEATGAPSSPEFFGVIAGILRGLAFVHARGMVHADVKPSNLLVHGARLAADASSAVVLADFGLAAVAADPTSSAARGTFPYAAPEVYAARLDARSDLYSFGAVLYELATGEAPFGGDDLAAVLTAQRRGPPPQAPLSEVPRELSSLILALLDPAPGARPQSADEVLSRVNDIAGTSFGATAAAPRVDPGAVLVGRSVELARLEAAFGDARAGRGGAVAITGEAGVGKSRLLDELVMRVQLAGAEAHRLDARSDSLGVSIDRDALDPESRFAVAEAVARTVIAPDTPKLLVLDDADQCEAPAEAIAAYLVRAAEACPVLVVVAGQDGDGAAARLAGIASASERGAVIELAPLDEAGIAALVTSTLSAEVGASLGPRLHRESGGNPGLASRALERLVERGSIARERGAWIIADEPLDIPITADASQRARERVARLSAETRTLLPLLSALGDPFTRGLAVLVLGEVGAGDADAFDRAAAELAAASLVVGDVAGGVFEISPAGFGDVLAAELPAELADAIHRAVIRSLEGDRDAGLDIDDEALARHALASDDRDRGAAAGLRAARRRAERLDHRGAIDWYQRVTPLLAGDDARAATEELADQLVAVGDIDDAAERYAQAKDASTAAADRVRIGCKLAELHRRQGDSDRALELLMTALDLARKERLVDGELTAHRSIGLVLWYRSEYVTALEHAVAGGLLADQHGKREAAIAFKRLQGTIETNRGDPRAALARLEEALAAAEILERPDLEAAVCAEIGRTAIHAADYPRAVSSLERAIAVYESRGNVERVAGAVNNLGAACYFLSDWTRAREAWERFRRLCERLDERSELVSALNNLGSLYRELGEHDEALRTLDRAAVLAADTDRAHVAAMILGNRGEVLARQGDLAGAGDCYRRALAEFERIGAPSDVLETERRLCELDVLRGRATSALDRAVDLARTARDTGAALEEGQLHRVAAAALRSIGDFDSADWFCGRAAELLTDIGARYPRAQVELEAGDLAATRGDDADARRHYEGAIETFSMLGARWDLSRARNRLRSLEKAPVTVSSDVPGMSALLDLSRSLGRLEVDTHLERVLDTLLEITQFERGFILLLDDEGRPREHLRRARGAPWRFGRDEAQFSGSIVRQVAASGDPVVITDIANEAELRARESVVALGLRRVMCAPMRARGRTTGIVYIDSQRLSTDDHAAYLPLVEALAAQAATAVENSRLIREERRRSELMGILAHEIRNPLSGILGYAEIGLAELGEDSEAGELFSRVRQDGQRLRRLVDNIMELSRQEAGKVDWSFAPIDVAALVSDAVASFRVTADRKGIELSIDTEGLDGAALGNEDRLMQVLANLLNNAVKFTPRGGQVTVRARKETVASSDPDAPPVPATELDAWAPLDPLQQPARDLIRIDVADTGPGMSESQRSSLFQKFAQGDTERKSSGIGLGLYISREIVLRHGGSIWVESATGEGATFSVRLPVA